MTARRITVKIANSTLEVPVYRDPATTEAIAQAVSKRIERITEASQSFDSYWFALLAAFEIACELDAHEREKTDDEAAYSRELLQILSRIRALTSPLNPS